LTIKLHSRYVKESELESDILTPILQPCSGNNPPGRNKTKHILCCGIGAIYLS